MDKIKNLLSELGRQVCKLGEKISSFASQKLIPPVKKAWAKASGFAAGKASPTLKCWAGKAAEFFKKPLNAALCGGGVLAAVVIVVLVWLWVSVWSWVDNITIYMPADVLAAAVSPVSAADVLSDGDVSASDTLSASDVVSEAAVATSDSDVPSASDAVSGTDVASHSDVVSSSDMPEAPVSVSLRLKKGATVADALAAANITLDESLSIDASLDTELVSDMVINIYRMMFVTVVADGGQTDHYTNQETVGGLLEECGIAVGELDRLSCSLESSTENNMTIVINRVVVIDEIKTEVIPYSTEKRENSSVMEGESSVITAGADGSKDVTYRSTYVDGVLESTEAVGEVITLEPVTEVVEYGTKRTTTTTRKTKPAKYVVSKEAVYDCDGSGHGYYIITYSDGSVVYQDF